MSRKTSYSELYTTLGTIVQNVTGRKWWRKAGIQAQPVGTYATIYLQDTRGFEQQVVESIEYDGVLETGEQFRQTPWNQSYLDVNIEFFRSVTNDSALEAATRVRTALMLEQRFWDIWEIAGLVGAIRIIDITTMFRSDIEPRTRVDFRLFANIADPGPLSDADIFDIGSETITVIHVGQDDVETEFDVDVTNPNN